MLFRSITRFGFLVEPLENQCSALVRNPAMANALIVLPEGPATYESGDRVTVQVLDWDSVVHEKDIELEMKTRMTSYS